MIVMQLKNICKSFAGIPVLENVDVTIQDRDRVAIVGRNGAGKSTLLKILTKEYGFDDGEFYEAKDIRIGYLAQHNDLVSDRSIYDELLAVFDHLRQEEEELLVVAERIEEQASHGETDYALIDSYSARQEAFADAGGYRYKSDVRGILIGLGFPEDMFSLMVNDLSGGQKTRLALGKLLLQAPEVLILDEPTNHLDIDTLTWLENYLLNYDGAIVLVSHDRYFLDKLVTVVYDITFKRAFKYHGTYTQFLDQKAASFERQQKMFDKQQEEIRAMEDFVQRNIARASTTKRAQSTRKRLEKLERVDDPLGYEAEAKFSFTINRSSGNDVLRVDQMSFTHEGADAPLFTGASFHIYKGERVALIGSNGVGKTTLLRSIVDGNDELAVPPHSLSNGDVAIGTNVSIGYYDQEQRHLNTANTVLEELWQDYPLVEERKIRTILGNFLFTGDDVFKHVDMLSGGEKARLSLAKLMMKEANFLILDEPTNHLDLTSKELLESALIDYPGTIFFVSHDRYFINKIADKVFELTADGVNVYLGDYDYYVEKREENAEREKMLAARAAGVSGRLGGRVAPSDAEDVGTHLSYEEQKQVQREERRKQREIETIEAAIETVEAAIVELEEELESPELQADYEKMYEVTSAIEAKNAELEQLMEDWEGLH